MSGNHALGQCRLTTMPCLACIKQAQFFFNIRHPLVLLPVLGPLEQYIMPTLDGALLISYYEAPRRDSNLGPKAL